MSDDFNRNLAAAETLLLRFRQAPLPHWIDGRTVASTSGETFTNTTPIDNSAIGEVAAGNAADVDIACRAAHDRRKSGNSPRRVSPPCS